MEAFPEDFNRNILWEKLIKNQENLKKQTRLDFYEKTLSEIEKSEKTILLEFPKKLWQENRTPITNEILEKFGEIAIITVNGKYSLTRITNDKNDITNNIESIKLEF